MIKVEAWMNVYRAGVFHRIGKPGTFDRHPGDFYATEEEAKADIDYEAGYLCTVPCHWYEPSAEQPKVNPPDSKPVPLAITAAAIRKKNRELRHLALVDDEVAA